MSKKRSATTTSSSRERLRQGSVPSSASLVPRLLKTIVWLGVTFVLLTPLVVTPVTAHQYSVGKAIYAHVLIEILVLAWAMLAWMDSVYRPPKSWIVAALGIYVLVGFVTAFTGVSWNHSIWSDFGRMAGVWDRAHWAAFAIVVAAMIRSSRDSRTLLIGVVVVGVALSVLAIGQAYGLRPLSFLRAGCRVDATTGNPSFLAAVLLTSILAAAGLLGDAWTGREVAQGWRSHRSSRLTLGLCGSAIILATVALLFTGTRGAILGLLVGAAAAPVGTYFLNRHALLKVIQASGLVFACLTVVFAVDALVGLHTMRCQEETTSSRLIQTSGATGGTMSIRLELVKTSLHAFRERPLLGWGPENFQAPFNRFSDAAVYRLGFEYQDKAHNQVLEELVAGGLIGIVAYGLLWASILRSGVRMVRRNQSMLPLFVLAALVGYFVQDLFIFDTPVTLLSFSLLTGCLAAWDRHPVDPVQQTVATRPAIRTALKNSTDAVHVQPARPWIPIGIGAGGVFVAVFAIYAFGYRPFAAAKELRTFQSTPSTFESLTRVERAIQLFPPLANLPREYAFARLTSDWANLTPDEQRYARIFVERELEHGLHAEPSNARLLMGALPLLQVTASSPERLAEVEPLLRRLQELAPLRVQTHQRLAVQRLLNEDWTGAREIVNAFLAQAPQTEERFQAILIAAQCEGQCQDDSR